MPPSHTNTHTNTHTRAVARPVVKPALRRLWRDEATIQLGVSPPHAVILPAAGGATPRVLDLLDGTRNRAAVLAEAAARGVPRGVTEQVLDLLESSHALTDAETAVTPPLPLALDDQDRLGPDVASLSLTHADGGADIVFDRAERSVSVIGAGRVGAGVAALLVAAGIGAVSVHDDGVARPGDVAAAGLQPHDVGRQRGRAMTDRLRRLSPGLRDCRPEEADLVIVAPPGPAQGELLDGLAAAGRPHLLAAVRETSGVIGPLVLPGRSSCSRCHELLRHERDASWPLLATQLAIPRREGTEACDGVLAAVVAGHTAQQALTLLDRDRVSGRWPATVDGTLELTLPDWRVRRRSWSAHPSCPCTRGP